MAYTRFGLEGYGVRRAGSFSGKVLTDYSHPVTRFGLEGYGVRRAGSFANKTVSVSSLSEILNNPFFAHIGRFMNR